MQFYAAEYYYYIKIVRLYSSKPDKQLFYNSLVFPDLALLIQQEIIISSVVFLAC